MQQSPRGLALVVVAGMLAAGGFGAASAATSEAAIPPPVVRVAGDAPAPLPSTTVPVSSAGDADQPLTVTVTLRRTDQAGFDRALAQIEDPHSPEYRHYLTQQQMADRFGPSASDYEAVASWLVSKGFRVVQGSVNRLTVSAEGTRAEAERAFEVSIRSYRAGARTVYANDQAPALPAALASHVVSVSGLSTTAEPTATPNEQLAQANGIPPTCAIFAESIFFSLLFVLLFWEFAPLFAIGAYFAAGAVTTSALSCITQGVQAGFAPVRQSSASPAHAPAALPASVSPQKIGLLEFDTYHPSDVQNYGNEVPFLAGHTLGSLTEKAVNGGVATPGPGESEVLLDIDAAMTIDPLPSATFTVYDGPPSTSFEQMFQAMVNDPAPPTVISNSWAQCEDQTPSANAVAIDSVLSAAATAGISVFNGAGDHGSSCLDGAANTVAVPADSPHATAVGGSTLLPFTAGLTYPGETWWDGSSATPPTGQGGFGVSKYFSAPAYQGGVGGRSVPDVVAPAEPHDGVEICEADRGGCPSGLLFGGTSLAAPEWAAWTALLDAFAGSQMGQANPFLYAHPGAFHTLSGPNNDSAHVGLGSPDLLALYAALTGTAAGSADASTSSAAASTPVPADGTTHSTVQVALRDGSGLPVSGKTITVTPNVGSSAIVAPAHGTTDADGGAVFTATDAVPETVTYTVEDTDDTVTLTTHPTTTFITPPAAGASIATDATLVPDDGTTPAHITVYLADSLGRPSVGKTVSLAQTGSAGVSPGTTTTTDGSGNAVFTVTDSTAETVTFTATDVTDGNLAVPGSVSVDFAAPAPCPVVNSVAAPGSAMSTFASGFPTFGCIGNTGLGFDHSGNLDALTYVGNLYQFGSGGGTASPSTQLTGFTTFSNTSGVAIDAAGDVFVGVQQTGGHFNAGQILQVDPTTGSVTRTIATGLTCPVGMAIDPISQDLFYTQACGDPGNYVQRIASPASCTTPCTPATYASGLPFALDPIAFAPDGTLFAGGGGNADILEISATNSANPGVLLRQLAVPAGVEGLAVAPGAGAPTAVYAKLKDGTVDRVGLSSTPPVTPLVTNGDTRNISSYMTFGPDGCLYADQVTSVLKITAADGTCGTLAGPQLALSASTGSPMTATSDALTATLTGPASPAGTPIEFAITGANTQLGLADAAASGAAAFSYTGIGAGVDTVTAFTTINGTTITSNPVTIDWQPGKDATFLTLNQSQAEGAVNAPASFTVNLVDLTAGRADAPPDAVPIAGATITVTINDPAACTNAGTSTTDASGTWTCTATPTRAGLFTVTATYGGDGSHAASSTRASFFAGGPSTTPPAAGGGGGGGGGPTTTTTSTTTTMAPAATVTRVSGKDRLATAIAVSQAAFPNPGSAGAVVLARDDQFPDALAGVPLAASRKAPVLLTPPAALDSSVLAEIQRVLPSGGTVVLLGGTAALSSAVADAIVAAGFTVTRFAGADRYATAVAIASQGLGDPQTIFEVSGQDFADAVSAGPAASLGGGAILLTAGSTQHPTTAAYLAAHANDARVAVGGPASSADPTAGLALVGSDRYDTSARVADHYFPAPSSAGVATGAAFPDALTGGAAVAEAGGPVLLTDPSTLPAPVAAYLSAERPTLKTVDVFGGTLAVSDVVFSEIQTAVG